MNEKIKNLDQELVLYLQVLQSSVKNLNAKKDFWHQMMITVKNLQFNVK